jgi:hypothetical protein
MSGDESEKWPGSPDLIGLGDNKPSGIGEPALSDNRTINFFACRPHEAYGFGPVRS